ncbi:MAG: GIY-YIG nuclease family protein [Deltaproteobacteria bacterium]|nr:GIY-YIG nuclease family protein [Deltaproteobacteria bacterium]
MDKRKAIINEYKQRKITGGIYRVTNTRSRRYLLDYTPNIKAKQNAFDFMVSTGSCFHHRLRKDWLEYGGKAFVFEILDTLEKKKEQSQDDFVEDLKVLVQCWREKLDLSTRYE